MTPKHSVDGQIAQAVSALALVLALVAPAHAASEGAGELKGLAACRGVSEPLARLGCFDDLASRTLGPPAMQTTPAAPSPAATAAPAPGQQSPALPERSSEAAAPPVNGYTLPAKFEKLTFTIARVDASIPGKLRLITADGPVLEQTHPIKNFKKTPAPGDPVMVFHQMLGFGCRTNKSDYFRCRPIEN